MVVEPKVGTLVQAVHARFVSEFSATPRVFFAPGRVNLIGAHLDYNGGDVLPLAVDKGIYLGARLRDDRRIRLVSLNQPNRVEVDANCLGPVRDPAHGWASYPLGVWQQFAKATQMDRGVDLVFAGDLPMASGLSSSAAIEVATATALNHLHDTRLEPQAIAMIAHHAETQYVGVKCGIMDQFASAFGRPRQLLLLHCLEPRWEFVPVEDAFEVLVLDTRKPRELAASGFNQRVRECGEALAILRRVVRDAPCLAAFTPADLAVAGAALSGVIRQRARHVVTEMARVAEGVSAFRRKDMAALGDTLNRSHVSTRDDYEVSCAELDVITAAARECPQVFGARLTGAGFGGCAIALVKPGTTEAVVSHVALRYRERFPTEPRFDVLHAGPGPREIIA